MIDYEEARKLVKWGIENKLIKKGKKNHYSVDYIKDMIREEKRISQLSSPSGTVVMEPNAVC